MNKRTRSKISIGLALLVLIVSMSWLTRDYIPRLLSFGGWSDVKALGKIKEANAATYIPGTLLEERWNDNAGYPGESLSKFYRVESSVVDVATSLGWSEADYYMGGWQTVPGGNPDYPLVTETTYKDVKITYRVCDKEPCVYTLEERINREAEPSYIEVRFDAN